MIVKEYCIYILSVVTLLTFALPSAGQETAAAQPSSGVQQGSLEPPLLGGWGRWSAKLNLLDLACAVPNLGIEFDLGKDRYSKSSLSLTARCNWTEWHSIKPGTTFDVLELRPEYRQYRRGLERTKGVLYWGVYGSAGRYGLKLSETGHQGFFCGAGAGIGTVMPLHEYRKFAMDIEFGASVGLCLRTDDAYRLSPDGQAYVRVPEQSRGFGPVPFPVVSELRMALVFRKVSAKSRYHLTTEETKALRTRNIERAEKKQNRKEGIEKDEKNK